MLLVANNCHCFYFLVSEKHKLNRSASCQVLPYRVQCHVSYMRPNMTWIPNMVCCQSLSMIWQPSSMVSSVQPVEKTYSYNLQRVPPPPQHTYTHKHTHLHIYIYIYLYTKHTLSPCSTVTKHCFEHVMCSWCSFPEFGAKRDTNASFLTSAIG